MAVSAKESRYFEICHNGSIQIMRQQILHKYKPRDYTKEKWGFQLFPEGKIAVKNAALFDSTEREIRRYLDLPAKGFAEPPAPEPKPAAPAVAKMAEFFPPELKKETFEVRLSSYENGRIAVFLPAKFEGWRFSCVYSDGVLLFAPDDRGNRVGEPDEKNGAAVVTFATGTWLGKTRLSYFNSYRQEVSFDGEFFEIKLEKWMMGEEPAPQPAPPPPAAPPAAQAIEAKPKETRRQRAKRYIDWLNEFAANDGYEIKSEDGRLVLEKFERIG